MQNFLKLSESRREAEEMDDAEVYKYLVATKPDGKVMLSESEQEAFQRKMGIGKHRRESPDHRNRDTDCGLMHRVFVC